MKKQALYSLFFLIASLTSGCSSEETSSPGSEADIPLTFSVKVDKAAHSRGTVTDLTELQRENKGFVMYTYYDDKGNTLLKNLCPNFMYNQTTQWNGKDQWVYSPVKYWPTNPKDVLHFYAYAPQTPFARVISPIRSDMPGTPTLLFTVHPDVKQQIDLTAASTHKTCATESKKGAVAFAFQHVLSRVAFKVKQTRPTADTRVYIRKIHLHGNFASTGTLKMPEDLDKDFSAAQAQWTLDAANPLKMLTITATTDDQNNFDTQTHTVEKKTYLDFQGKPILPEIEGMRYEDDKKDAILNAQDSYLMFIPATCTSASKNPLSIDVECDFVTDVDGDDSPNFKRVKVTRQLLSAAPQDFTFEPGKAYVFDLTIDTNVLKMEIKTGEWGNGAIIDGNMPLSLP